MTGQYLSRRCGTSGRISARAACPVLVSTHSATVRPQSLTRPKETGSAVLNARPGNEERLELLLWSYTTTVKMLLHLHMPRAALNCRHVCAVADASFSFMKVLSCGVACSLSYFVTLTSKYCIFYARAVLDGHSRAFQ